MGTTLSHYRHLISLSRNFFRELELRPFISNSGTLLLGLPKSILNLYIKF